MSLFKWVLKESGLQLAFVVLGSFLLLSWWILQNLDQDLLAEFKEQRVSVIIDSENVDGFRRFLQAHPDVIRFSIQDSEDNKASLAQIYPELKSVLSPLEAEYFPVSATVSLSQLEPFLFDLESKMDFFRSFVVHRAPEKLRTFMRVSVGTFLVLWLFTLGLVLFFQLEYLAHRDEQKWSLMKMLGAKPGALFWPICWQQLLRVSISSIVAIAVSYWGARQFESVFAWGWDPAAIWNWSLFLGISLALSVGVFLSLFTFRFRRVPLG